MKKLIYLLMTTTIIVTTLLPFQSTLAEKNERKTPKYLSSEDLLTKYNDLVNRSQENRKNGKLVIPETEVINGDFAILNLVAAPDTEIVDHETNGSTVSVIQHDTNSDIYSLITVNENTDFLTYIVDGEMFEMRAEGENINLYSAGSQVLPLVITEYDYFNPYVDKMTDSYFTSSGTEDVKESKASFGAERGPFYKNSTDILQVISTVATSGGLFSVVTKHPVIGTISTIVGFAAMVGSMITQTFYIKFWQSNSLSDLTYVKERGTYYQYSNYSGFVKNYTTYFYSSWS